MKDFMLVPNYDEDTKNKFNIIKGKMMLTPTNLDYYMQKIRACLSFQLGEYFTDSTIGLPYIPDFSTSKTEHRNILLSSIQKKINELDFVKKLLTFNSDYDSINRRLDVRFTALTIDNIEIAYSDSLVI